MTATPTTRKEDFGVRPGEVSVELPGQPDAGIYFIGRIRTPWTHRNECPKNARGSEAVCTVELDARYVPRASRMSRPARTWCCSIGWTRRRAI